MKFFLIAAVTFAGVFASPALNRNDECPTLEQIGAAIESHFGFQIPDGIVDCLHGGDNCPFESLEDAQAQFEAATGMQFPVDEDFDAVFDACLNGGDCPSLDEVVAWVKSELNIELSDEVIAVIYNCAEDILNQLGF